MFDRFRCIFPVIAIASCVSVIGTAIAQSPTPTPTVTPTITPTPIPTVTPTTRPAPSPSPVDTSKLTVTQLLSQASSAGSFTTLAAAIKAAGVGNALQGRGKVTIFAPTDAAFAALPAGTVEKLVKPANRALLARILGYHVVPGAYTSKTLPNGNIKALSGGISTDVTPQRVIINNAKVVQADIVASNGVIHAVDRLVVPREIRQQLGSLK
jgi:uncharacterized surface protein with fasciclin (FAS1) repeats